VSANTGTGMITATARAAFPKNAIIVRLPSGETVTGLRSPMTADAELLMSGSLYRPVGRVRLITSEILGPKPKPNDEIKITEEGAPTLYIVTNADPSSDRETIMVTYGSANA
jgi:hypothetical protein